MSPEVSPERHAPGRQSREPLTRARLPRFEVAFGVEIDLAQLAGVRGQVTRAGRRRGERIGVGETKRIVSTRNQENRERSPILPC